MDKDDGDKALGDELRAHREEAGLSQTDAAKLVGISRVTLNRYEQGKQRAPYNVVRNLKLLYADRTVGAAIRATEREHPGKTVSVDLDTTGTIRVGVMEDRPGYSPGADPWSPNPALVAKIPKRAYDVAIAYCRRLESAGWPREEIEQIERLMIDPRYAQANKRKGNDLTEDEHIMLIDATWEAVKASAAALGRQV